MTTYHQFLDAHRSRANRFGHFITILLSIGIVIANPWPWCLIAIPVLAIGGGLSHAIFERNRPAFFAKPLEIPLLIAYDLLMAIQTMLGIDELGSTEPPHPHVQAFGDDNLDEQFGECWLDIGCPDLPFTSFEAARECFRRGIILGSSETFVRMRTPSVN